MNPTQMQSIQEYDKSNLKNVYTKVRSECVVDENIVATNKPPIKKVSIKEPTSELIHRDSSPTVDQSTVQILPAFNQMQRRSPLPLFTANESLAITAMTGIVLMVDQYYGLPGVIGVLALAKGVSTVAEWTKWVKPGQGYHTAGLVGTSVMSACCFSSIANGRPVPFIGAVLGKMLADDEFGRENKSQHPNP